MIKKLRTVLSGLGSAAFKSGAPKAAAPDPAAAVPEAGRVGLFSKSKVSGRKSSVPQRATTAAGSRNDSAFSASVRAGLSARFTARSAAFNGSRIELQYRAITELRTAAEAITSPADLGILSQLENTGRIPRLTMLRAQVEWIRQELLDNGPGAALIDGLDADHLPPGLRKIGFGIVSSLLGPLIKSRFDYIQSLHTDGVLHEPMPPKYLGWCMLGEKRSAIKFEVVGALSLCEALEAAEPRALALLFELYPFDCGETQSQQGKMAINAGPGSGTPEHPERRELPILQPGRNGPEIRLNRPFLERGFRSLGVDSAHYGAAASLFQILDSAADSAQVSLGQGQFLFINNRRLLHSREPITGRTSLEGCSNQSGSDCSDTVCRSWISEKDFG